MRTIDISTPLRQGMPAWPDSPGVGTERFLSIANGAPANASLLSMDVHCGTHIDAPLHFIEGASSVESIGLDRLVGGAFVLETGTSKAIDSGVLEAAQLPESVTRLLLKTSNSGRADLADGPFSPDYCAVTPDGAEWLVDRGVDLIGIDYMSIQRFEDPPDAHTTLLGAGVVILEGLRLADAPPGPCELICMPLLIQGAEASPARAAIRIPS